MVQDKSSTKEETEKVLELLNQTKWALQSDHDLLKNSQIETSVSQLFRKLVNNPQEGLLDLYFNIDESVQNDVIATSVNNLVVENKNVKAAKYSIVNSQFSYYLVLNDDSESGKDIFYNLSHSFLNSELSNKFSLSFNFVKDSLFQKITGTELK